jgi:hypothetical protein
VARLHVSLGHFFPRALGLTVLVCTWHSTVRIPVIGVLHGVSAAQWTDRMVGFHRGLGEAGLRAVKTWVAMTRAGDGEISPIRGCLWLTRAIAAQIIAMKRWFNRGV